MSAIVCYLIVAITIHIVANILENGAHSRELGIVVLTMNIGMLSTTPATVSETIVGIITISGLIVLILSTLDEETTTLILSGITGLILITETNSLLILYLGLELIGLTFYILAARERKGIKSTEAGIKYFTLGALSSGILLLGITLNYATTGTTNIEIITGASATLIKIGLLFKLGAAPFHV
jgi:NADH:ubiquinone oxidoreductase subunit 2 (subunit N)